MSNRIVSGRDESVRLFQNPVLEYFSHIHPATPVVVYVPLVALAVVSGAQTLSVLSVLVTIASGVGLWTLTEYTIHRWAFHLRPRSAIGKKLHFLVHGIHHAYPQDSTRLVMPPLVSLPLALGFYMCFTIAVPAISKPLWAGFIIGYVAYDVIHYLVHHRTPTSRIGRHLKKHHMHHHFVNPDSAFGVSNPLWDRIFVTSPVQAKRETARRRKLQEYLQRQTSNGTQQIRNHQRRKGSRQ